MKQIFVCCHSRTHSSIIILICFFCIALSHSLIFAQTQEDITSFLSTGQKLYQNGKLAGAQIEFENVLIIDAKNFEAKIWLAQVFADLKNMEKAKELILEAAKQAPDHPKVVQIMKLIGASQPLPNLDDTIKQESMILLGGNSSIRKYGIVIPDEKVDLAKARDDLIDFDENKSDEGELEKAIDTSVLNDHKGPLGEVFALWENQGLKAGLNKYFELLISNPKLLEHSDKGLLIKGERVYVSRLKSAPSDLEAVYYVGVIHFLGGNLEKAEKILSPLKADHQGHGKILTIVFEKLQKWRTLEDERIRARKQAEQERIAMALELKQKEDAEKAENQNKKDTLDNTKVTAPSGEKVSAEAVEAGLFHKQGFELYKKGRLDEAIEKYNKAIQAKGDEAEYHYHLGLAWTDKGLAGDSSAFGKAKQSFQQAISLAPGSKLAIDSKSMVNDIKSAEQTLGN